MEEPLGQPSCDGASKITVGAATSRGWKSKLPLAVDSIRKRWWTVDGDKQLGGIVDGCRISPLDFRQNPYRTWMSRAPEPS